MSGPFSGPYRSGPCFFLLGCHSMSFTHPEVPNDGKAASPSHSFSLFLSVFPVVQPRNRRSFPPSFRGRLPPFPSSSPNPQDCRFLAHYSLDRVTPWYGLLLSPFSGVRRRPGSFFSFSTCGKWKGSEFYGRHLKMDAPGDWESTADFHCPV